MSRAVTDVHPPPQLAAAGRAYASLTGALTACSECYMPYYNNPVCVSLNAQHFPRPRLASERRRTTPGGRRVTPGCIKFNPFGGCLHGGRSLCGGRWCPRAHRAPGSCRCTGCGGDCCRGPGACKVCASRLQSCAQPFCLCVARLQTFRYTFPMLLCRRVAQPPSRLAEFVDLPAPCCGEVCHADVASP